MSLFEGLTLSLMGIIAIPFILVVYIIIVLTVGIENSQGIVKLFGGLILADVVMIFFAPIVGICQTIVKKIRERKK